MRLGDPLIVFDGRGGEYAASIAQIDRQQVSLKLGEHRDISRESPLFITLAQGISRGERMDYTIQKAVELGVNRIVPLATDRSTVKLDDDRARKRGEHWSGIMRHAAEQSGRTGLPVLEEVRTVVLHATQEQASLRLMLDPGAEISLMELPAASAISLAIGPEGGFSAAEREILVAAGYQRVRLGPRVLRTETAALVAIALLQAKFGDLV
jgi:16S rRNA (uracil1498-N3)-methyltransferase